MSYTGPYTNFHEINLNLFIRALKKLKGGIGGESLVKKSNVEFDYEWKALTAQDVGALPDSYTAPVDSVNGKTGVVVLDAQDVGALPDSYTPPVISVNGKTGAVVLDSSDIEFNETNVYNALINALPTDTAMGNPANFPDGAGGIPVKSLIVAIEPVQSGSGDPAPDNIRPISGWIGVQIQHTGKNLISEQPTLKGSGSTLCFDFGKDVTSANVSLSFTAVNAIANGSTQAAFADLRKNDGTHQYIVLRDFTNESGIAFNVAGTSFNGRFKASKANITFRYVDVYYTSNAYSRFASDCLSDFQLEVGSTATDFEPYTGTTYEVDWTDEAGTVYGGTATYNGDGTWTLITAPYYSSYAGETLVGPWVSDRDAYAPGTTPTIGAQVVDMGGTATTYTITEDLIYTLLGQNNIWADTGGVTVEYFANAKLYIDKQIGGA